MTYPRTLCRPSTLLLRSPSRQCTANLFRARSRGSSSDDTLGRLRSVESKPTSITYPLLSARLTEFPPMSAFIPLVVEYYNRVMMSATGTSPRFFSEVFDLSGLQRP
jgi:hypothetical protein